MPPPDDIANTIVALFQAEGLNLGAWGLAWARVAPTVALVPAFGLRATPVSFRVAMGLLLGASVVPALASDVPDGPWVRALLYALWAGLPVALGAALPIWIASMAGGIMDAVYGGSDSTTLPVLEGRRGIWGTLWGLLACFGFLATGGPARVAMAVVEPPKVGEVVAIVLGITSGVTIAASIAAPMLVGAVMVEIAIALVARAATPASLAAVLGMGRSALLVLLGALFFERIATLVLQLMGSVLRELRGRDFAAVSDKFLNCIAQCAVCFFASGGYVSRGCPFAFFSSFIVDCSDLAICRESVARWATQLLPRE